MQNWRLDDLLSSQSGNQKLEEGLKIVRPRPTIGSLAAYDEFEFDEMYRFMQNFRLETDDIITGIESFPGEMMKPAKIGVDLPEEIYNHLVQYYKDAYDLDFVSLTESTSNKRNNIRNSNQIIVLPRINQFSRIRIGSEIFGSTISPRYMKNSYILANFIQENETTEVFPGQVQFFFEHIIKLSEGNYNTHRLAFVKWYLPVEDQRKRFYCQIDNNDNNSCNIEIWKYDFYNISRDCIIPVHNIYSRFIASEFTIGKRNPITYMAVIPINRHFHI